MAESFLPHYWVGMSACFKAEGTFACQYLLWRGTILCSQNGNEYFLTIRDTPGNPLCRTITAAYMREDVQVMNHFVLPVF